MAMYSELLSSLIMSHKLHITCCYFSNYFNLRETARQACINFVLNSGSISKNLEPVCVHKIVWHLAPGIFGAWASTPFFWRPIFFSFVTLRRFKYLTKVARIKQRFEYFLPTVLPNKYLDDLLIYTTSNSVCFSFLSHLSTH